MVLLVRLGLVGWRYHTNHCHPAADGSSGPHRPLLIQYPKALPVLFWAPPAVVSCVQRSLAPPVLTDLAGPVTTHSTQTPACLFIAHLNCGEGWEGLAPTPSPAAYIFHCLASSSCVQRSRRVSSAERKDWATGFLEAARRSGPRYSETPWNLPTQALSLPGQHGQPLAPAWAHVCIGLGVGRFGCFQVLSPSFLGPAS